MAAPVLVVVFLRGGCDGLSLVSPTGDANYVAARPGGIRVERDGDSPGLVLDGAAADADFRFHPQAKAFSELYNAGDLAVIHAAGLTDATRSHFDAEDRMERAAQGGNTGGWLGRWLAAEQPEGVLPALAVGASAPESLRGADAVAVAQELAGLRLAAGHGFSNPIRRMLAAKLGGDPLLGAPIKRLLTLSDVIETRVALDADGNLRPYAPEYDYPENNSLAPSLKTVAQSIKLDLGLRVATVDYGGWDTHVDQGGQFGRLVNELSTALMAFWRDLGKQQERVSVVVMSEFGRRLKANESGGTDHGHGNVMLALGAPIKGGAMYGRWPGLDNDSLDSGADLAITTDYRHVLAELMAGHMKFGDTATLFPSFASERVGFLRA
ncbi:MAG: DUF1501 domain-containing protein [Devosia sp.]